MEKFVVVVDDEGGSKVISVEFNTQKEAVTYAKQIRGAWVELRGGEQDGEVAWQSRKPVNIDERSDF